MNSGHNCTLVLKTFDALPAVGIQYCHFLVKKWREWSTINESTPETIKYVSSSAVFREEKRRHFRSSPWIIHPFSKLRFLWNTIMVVVYMIAFVTIPLMTSFRVLYFARILMDDVNLYIYALFWIDIFMNCITGVYDKKNAEVVLEQMRMTSIYLKSFFFIDVITSLPYDRLTLPWRNIPGPGSGVFIPLINLLPNLKLFRFITLCAYNRQLFKYFNIQNLVQQAGNTVIFSLFVIHWFACFCYSVPALAMHLKEQDIETSEGWMSRLKNHDPDMHLLYRHSLFMAVTNLLASNYGYFPPVSEGHLIVCTILMLSGAIFIDYAIVRILRMKSQRYIAKTKYEEIMNQLNAYMRQKQLPEYMKRRLLAYYYYRFSKSFYREKEISSTLPGLHATTLSTIDCKKGLILVAENLRREIALHSSRRFVQNVALFRDLPRNVLESIVVNLKMELYLPNDVIIKAGTQGDCMFFLASGTVAVLTPTGKEVCHLEDGAHFGEVALLVQDQKRVASVVAIDVCNVFRLERKDFRRCIAVHTDLFAKIERLATGRMEKTVLLEEQHKRFLLHRSNRRTSAGLRNIRTKSLYPSND